MKSREHILLDRLREATRALRETLDERDRLALERSEPLAIVGIGCRFPSRACSPRAYWDLLCAGRDAVTSLDSRWALIGARPGPGVPGWAGLLDEAVDEFDPDFFGISPREARSMDPQHRLLLEVCWEALEDAGIAPRSLERSRTGVFVGACSADYASSVLQQPAMELDAYGTTGNMLSIAAGRLSYSLGLQGPCLMIDTACSSSLVSIHLACRSLRTRESDLALAGGVNLLLSADTMEAAARTQALSPDGRCHTFDAAANGFVRGEGCGMVVLKRFSDAQRDGDRIWALVRGTAVNQDGRSTGLTAPNVLAQEALLRDALSDARVDASAVGYVETHGTGTALGDPIEVAALRAVLGRPRSDGSRCVLGAVKTNIGHLEGAAGIAGLIKAALVLQHQHIPQNLNFRMLNAHIELQDSALELATEPRAWPRTDRPRFAGVSSFGLSGTNAHVVLEESPRAESALPPERHGELVVLSARSPQALTAQAARLRKHLLDHPEQTLGAVASSLATARSALPHRVAFVANHRAELLGHLESVERGDTTPGMLRGRPGSNGAPKVVFVFPGQGSQWMGMGRTLLTQEPAFRQKLEECERAIQSEAGFSVLKELAADESTSQLDRIELVQPILFAVGVALAALWRSWGVQADAVVGHSLGEIAAAHVAGALSLSDAVAIICRRSRLLGRIRGQGEMAMVELTAAESEQALIGHRDRLSVAVSNSARSTVIAGEPGALGKVLAQLEAKGVFCRRVKVDVASHSPQVEPLLPELRRNLAGLTPSAVGTPMLSTVTAEWVNGAELGAEYWSRNLRQPVRFAETVQALIEDGHGLFVEMSPHPILVPAIQETLQAAGRNGAAVGSLRREQPERPELLGALGALWGNGYPVDWKRQFPSGAKVELPTYPWQRQRYWVEAPRVRADRGVERVHEGGHPMLGEAMSLFTQANMRVWECALNPKQIPWLGDHRIQGGLVVPGTGHLEMALSAAAEMFGPASSVISEVALLNALVLPEGGALPVQCVATEEQPGQVRFRIASRQEHRGHSSFREHSRAVLRRVERSVASPRLDLSALRARMTQAQPAGDLYATMARMGLELGPAFQGLRALWRGKGEALGRLELPAAAGSPAGYHFHPALLDACLQVMVACFPDADEDTPWVPVEVGMLRLFQRPSGELYCHVRALPVDAASSSMRRADLTVVDGSGAAVVELRGLVVQRLGGARPAEADGWYIGVEWEPAAVPPQKIWTGQWLILGSGDGLGSSLCAVLEEAGQIAAHVPQVPESASALRALLTKRFQGKAPTGVVHLGGLDGEEPLQGCQSVLSVVQGLAGMRYRDPPRLWLLTRGAQAVGGSEVSVMQAPLLGLGRTLALEHGELRCARLDLDPRRPSHEESALLAELLADGSEEEICLRGGERFVSRLVRSSPETRARGKADAVRKDGSYLITGGLGGLGLSVATWLAEQGAGHLVLVGRSGAASAEQQAAVQELRAKGARVTVASTDVADAEQVGAVLQGVKECGMPLRGVVHAAGVLADAVLMQQTEERFRTVFAPKVLGAWNLHKLTCEAELDIFVLYSSAAGLLGSPGQGNYAAANAFLDALAHHRRALGLPALSIDWGVFAEKGLAAAKENRGARLAARGMRNLTPAEGNHALERLLQGSEAQIGVIPLDLRQWGAFHQLAASSPRLSRLRTESGAGVGRRREAQELRAQIVAAKPEARSALLLAFLRTEAAQVLRTPPERLDVEAPLTSLGMDSLMGLELRNRIESLIGARIPATLLWTYPKLTALSTHLVNQMIDESGSETASVRPPPTQPDNERTAERERGISRLDDRELFALLDNEFALARKHGA